MCVYTPQEAILVALSPWLTLISLDGALAFCAIGLADKAPRLGGVKTQQTMVILYAGVMLVLYSFLLSIFRVKNGGYPFALPPFL